MNNRTLATLTVAALLAVGASACDDGGPQTKVKADSATPAGHASKSPSPKPAPVRPKPSEYKVAVKVKSKQCFGYGAGCNVTYNVALSKDAGASEFEGDWDVKYKVFGDPAGPVTDTLEMHSNGKYDVPYENFISTSGPSVKPHAVIVGISKHVGY